MHILLCRAPAAVLIASHPVCCRTHMIDEMAHTKREQSQQTMQANAQLQELREEMASAAADASLRHRTEVDTVRLELSSRLQSEQESTVRLRNEVAALQLGGRPLDAGLLHVDPEAVVAVVLSLSVSLTQPRSLRTSRETNHQ